MFFVCCKKYKNIDNLYGIKDTDDGTIDFYTKEDLQKIIDLDLGIEIDGVILNSSGVIERIIRSKVPSFFYLCKHNSNFSHLLDEWDYDKNSIKPYEISKSDNRLIYWKCNKGHKWTASVHSRTRDGNGHKNFCPVCFNVERNRDTSFSEQMIYFYLSKFINVILHYKLEDRVFDLYLPDYNIILEYDSVIHLDDNVHNNDLYKNKLATKYSKKLIRISEVNYSYNDCTVIYVNNNLDEIVLTILRNLGFNDIDSSIVDSNRDRYTILSMYKSRFNDSSSNLLVKYPSVTKFWDYKLNFPLKPEDFTYGSREYVWWICEFCGKSFKSSIHHIFDNSPNHIRVHRECRAIQYNKMKSEKTDIYYFLDKRPELVKYWSSSNKYKPNELSYKSRISILFYCSSCGEEISRVLSGVAKSGICKCRKCKEEGK